MHKKNHHTKQQNPYPFVAGRNSWQGEHIQTLKRSKPSGKFEMQEWWKGNGEFEAKFPLHVVALLFSFFPISARDKKCVSGTGAQTFSQSLNSGSCVLVSFLRFSFSVQPPPGENGFFVSVLNRSGDPWPPISARLFHASPQVKCTGKVHKFL